MKSLILILLLFPLLSFSQKKECDCYKYYTGTFYIPPNNGFKDTLIIQREENIQFEYKAGDFRGRHNLFIFWKNDCTYVLRNVNKNASKEKKIQYGDIINKIQETGDDYYIVKAWAKMKGAKKMEFTLYVYPSKE